jgi:hypothetical protein
VLDGTAAAEKRDELAPSPSRTRHGRGPISTAERGEDEAAADVRLGQKRTLGRVRLMSALPPKAEIGGVSTDVRFVPKADMAVATRSL